MVTSNTIHRTGLLGILGACALVLAGSASADEFGVPKANIHYGDLNLETAKGAKSLYQRIEKASYEACRNYDRDDRDNADPASLQACRRKIIRAAVAKIGKATLYAEYNARNPMPLPSPIVTAEAGH